MRRSFTFRLLAALLGALFAFNLVQPAGMTGMTGMSASGMPMAGMAMPGMPAMTMPARPMPAMASANAAPNASSTASASATARAEGQDFPPGDVTLSETARAPIASVETQATTQQQSSTPAKGQEECNQHDCCCSALVNASVAPVAALSWLPDYVISQYTPDYGDCVGETDAQLRLPFANGPPATVIG